jgi:uncharacterized protein YbbC (DUF1343 family)
LLYPGIGLLETTNFSVGRGTDAPFERIGAPWLDGAAFASTLNALQLPGISFTAVKFTPDSSTFANEACEGVRLTITERSRIDPLAVGFAIARQLRRDYRADWQTDRNLRLLGNQATLGALLNGGELVEIMAAYQDGLAEFAARRVLYLLYD